jgi:peptidyl-prolyl cis-trans isomerase C
LTPRSGLNWRWLLREPLVHFLIAGLVLFGLAEQHRRANDPYRIVITPARVAQLTSAYSAEFGTPPPPAMLPRLIDDYVAAEVLYREGKARGLDRDDEIVRRRVIQKVEFLEQDMASVPEPSEAELRSWYARNRARYAEAGRVTFSHIFFAAEAANEAPVRRHAAALLAGLAPATTRAPELGDSFPDQSDFADFGPDEARRLFGTSEVTVALFKAPVDKWAGPWRSAYGWHLVRVSAARPGGVPDFAAVREAAMKDYMSEARAAENVRRLAMLRARYRVVRK